MEDNVIRTLVASLDTKDRAARDAAWEQVRELGDRIAPFFEEFFRSARHLEARRDMAFRCIKYARVNESAFRVGLAAIADRSTIVRYRGCCVLAYSLRRDAVPALEKLLGHSDLRTVEDARAAIDAIQNRNHHYFIDRRHSGSTFWNVREGDVA